MSKNDKPTLIIMAAGMGSRYGGLKQVDKITDSGEIILDFSLYDAMMAGFERVIFVIKEEHVSFSGKWWTKEPANTWKWNTHIRK